MKRNFDNESLDNEFRKYNYNFDVIARDFLLLEFARHFDLSDTSKTLEVGSFDGSMTELILKYFNKLDVIEASEKMSNMVKEKFSERIQVFQGLIEEVSISKSYDNIFLIHTLEHVDDPIRVLSKLGNLLTPQGKLFIAVPNANALSRQIAVAMGIIEFNHAVSPGELAQGHLRTYSLDTLTNDIRVAGLKIIETGGVILKAFANFQMDAAFKENIVDMQYFEGANQLAKKYPDFATSIFAIVQRH